MSLSAIPAEARAKALALTVEISRNGFPKTAKSLADAVRANDLAKVRAEAWTAYMTWVPIRTAASRLYELAADLEDGN